MKQEFSTSWKGSKKPSKQRKYVANAPLHLRHKFMSVTLSKDLRKKYGIRNIPVRVNDKVKITRGSFEGKEGKVERVDSRKIKVYVTGIERPKADGSKVLVPIYPSNLMITDASFDDKRRQKVVERQSKGAK